MVVIKKPQVLLGGQHIAMCCHVYRRAVDRTLLVWWNMNFSGAACGPEFVAAVKDEMLMGVPKHVWNSRRACGKRLAVSCVSNGKDSPCIKSGGDEAPAVIATIVELAADDIILLSKEAFTKLAPLKVGLITVNVTLAPSDSAPVPLV
ncbi:hypothetical protein Mapa_009259 [Marchantia paleacea]|nr:hypothetical protein Mapa_009259 [Marchantia paleacea]